MRTESKIVRCPKCGSDQVMEILFDGPLNAKALQTIKFSWVDSIGPKLECTKCGHKFNNPTYLEQLINKNIKEGKFKEDAKR